MPCWFLLHKGVSWCIKGRRVLPVYYLYYYYKSWWNESVEVLLTITLARFHSSTPEEFAFAFVHVLCIVHYKREFFRRKVCLWQLCDHNGFGTLLFTYVWRIHGFIFVSILYYLAQLYKDEFFRRMVSYMTIKFNWVAQCYTKPRILQERTSYLDFYIYK